MTRLKNIRELMNVAAGYKQSSIILAANELGIFHCLGPVGTSAEGVARAIGATVRGTEILLDALVALGILQKGEGLYGHTPLSLELADETRFWGPRLRHSWQLYRRWGELDRIVREGPLPRAEVDEQERARRTAVFIGAMHAHGVARGRAIAGAIELEDVQRVIDIGGGSGAYSMALLERKPTLQVVIIDLETTLVETRKYLAGTPWEKAIELRCADIYADDFDPGSGFDLAIISHILHMEGPEQNRRLLSRIAGALRPGGRVLIQDFVLDEDRTAPEEAALFAVNMLVNTERGNAYTFAEFARWLEEAGFEPPERLVIPEACDVLLARKRAAAK